MDAEDDGVRKRKAVAGASQRKKPRRNVRDKSEFVSVEVGMREFRKRLAGSGAAESTGKAISSEETESTQKVKTKPTTRAKSQTSARAAAKKTPPAKTATTKTTKTPTARKLTLAEVKLQLEQEQKQRVESRIQALYQQTCSAASAVAATAPQAAATLPSVINTATSASAPEPASSGVAIESFNYSANAQGPNVGIAKVLPSVQAAVVDNNFLNNEMDVVKQIQVATTTSPVVEPTLSQTTNEFISDDADEDLMFAMALEEVERKLTTPQKPPSSDVVVAVTAPSSLASHSYQNADMSPSPVKPSVPTSQEKTQANTPTCSRHLPLMAVNQVEQASVVTPEVLEEMERLRRENELLRRSNELLQAAAISPEHHANAQPTPRPRKQRAIRKNRVAEPKSSTPGATTARYLNLGRRDTEHDVVEGASATGSDRTPERPSEHYNVRADDVNSRQMTQDNISARGLDESSLFEDHDTNAQGEGRSSEQGAYDVKRLQPEADRLSDPAETNNPELTESILLGSSTTEGDTNIVHSMEMDRDHTTKSSTGDAGILPMDVLSSIAEESEVLTTPMQIDQANTSELTDENISSKNMVATCPSPTMDGTIHCSVPNTNGSAISDAAVSGSDDDNGEEASYEEEGSSPKRTSTIDSGNYVKYKVQRDDDDDDAENDVFDGERNPREQLKEAVKPSLPLPVDPVKSIATSELGEIPTSCIPTNSTEVERKTAPSNTDDDGEDDEVITAKRNGRLGVIPLSDPESNSESDSEDNDSSESDDTPSANVLEAALKAAGGERASNLRTKVSSAKYEASKKDETTHDGEGRRQHRSTPKNTVPTSPVPTQVKTAPKKRKAMCVSSSTSTVKSVVKSSLLWPTLDEFYDFLLGLSPTDVRAFEQKTAHLQRYLGGKLPAQFSSVEEYCNIQFEAIMEELVASVSNSSDRRGGGSSGPLRYLSLTSVSPCGTQRSLSSAPSVGLSFGAIFSESAFSGYTSSSNDFILAFDGSVLGKSASDFLSGDLVLLRSPHWKNYNMYVFGVVLCNSVVAVGEKNVRSNGGPGENDQICVLARAQDRDRGDATESFSVMTELCLSNQRSPNWRWSLQQVHNVTTSAREFQAIKSISFFSNDLKQVLQRGQLLPSSIGEQLPRKPKKINPAGSILSPRLRRHLQKHYNESQMQAILGCLGEESRVIIQGPPGTGKTKTVLGLLSALLDGAGLSTLQKAKGTARIRVGASLQNAKTASVSKTVAETKIRILVAAPSNAAVDELVVRLLSEGLFDGEKGESYRPRIVRVGRPENGQLSSLAAAREASESKKNRKKMRKYAREVEEVLLESLVMKHRNAFPTVKQTRQAIIKNAQIVFCTLSGAGSVAMCDFAQCFDALIIDEAGQAVETSTLIPLKFRPHRVVLVGDHRQLPATVMSKKLVSMGYDRSLLQRLVENGSPVLLLTKQYRMHPEIAEFPSTYFYDGRLVQDAKMREWTAQEYHRNPAFKPLLFLDVQGGTQSQVDGSTSLRNLSEVEVVIQLVRRLITTFPQTDWKKRVGVIAPYKQQIYEVRSALGKLESECDRQLGIEVNTVDGFQGREKEIIIYSCVRTSHGGRNRKKKRRRKQSNGSEDDDVLDAFWADERRMNVAITRAKSSLWIVGNSTLLKQSRAWRALIQHTKDRGRYIGDPTGTVLAD